MGAGRRTTDGEEGELDVKVPSLERQRLVEARVLQLER